MKRKHIRTKFIHNIFVKCLSNNENSLMEKLKSMLIQGEQNVVLR